MQPIKNRIGVGIERSVACAERPIGRFFIEICVKRDASARYMTTVCGVQDVVQKAICGKQVTESVEGLERLPIILRYLQNWCDSPERLRDLTVVPPYGAHVLLSELADVRLVDGPGMIRTENARRTGFVFIDNSVAVLVGFIALAGVAMETASVMLLSFNLAWEKRKALAIAESRTLTPLDIEEVMFEGALLRVRPKVMTVATIFAALIPIMYGTGTGSDIIRRIAALMLGDRITATMLTPSVIPSIFVIRKRLAVRRVNKEITGLPPQTGPALSAEQPPIPFHEKPERGMRI
jgi:Cu/Ag efflux pump CusA